ncbi:hypothetical protein BC827DRAFT_1265346 [Russula dissimulans]|nr:hypothetical protein BC827DRAFT_1265346 [Russula dissimulans]
MAQVTLVAVFHFRSICSVYLSGPKTDPVIIVFRQVIGISITTFMFTAATFVAYILAFGLIPLASHLLRLFFGHFILGRWSPMLLWRSRALARQAFLLGVTTTGGWESAECLFDDKVQESLAVAPHTADPLLALISGITSSDPYYVHFGYTELRSLAEDDSPAATLIRTALLTLEKDYKTVIWRGAPPPPLAPPPPQPKAGGLVAPATPLIRKPVFKNVPGSPLHSVAESLAADGAVTRALTHSLDSTVSHLPDLVKSTVPAASVVGAQNRCNSYNGETCTVSV